MSTNGEVSRTASQTQPLPPTQTPTVNYAIALQQYQFQQSLVTKQLLAQQQAVAHAVSIKAASEQAAARAAEISRLLKGEKSDAPKENAEVCPKREKSESKSHSNSPSSSKSSRSKSSSPIKYRSGRPEHERYSPRGHRGQRSYRQSSYYYGYGNGDLMDHFRSRYGRGTDHSLGRRYSYYHRSRKRSSSRSRSMRYRLAEARSHRRYRFRSLSFELDDSAARGSQNRRSISRSPIDRSSISSGPRKPMTRNISLSSRSRSTSRSRKRSAPRPRSLKSHSPKCHQVRSPSTESDHRSLMSHSPRHHHVRSPSSESDQGAATGAWKRRGMSESPIDGSSISSSPRKPSTRGLLHSGNSQSCSTSSLHREDRRVRHNGNSNRKTNASDMDHGWQEKDGISRKQYIKNDDSDLSLSSESTSVDRSSKKTQLEPVHKKVLTGKLASTNGCRSSSTSSDEGSVHRMTNGINVESDPMVCAPSRSADDTNHKTCFLDCRSSGNEDFGNMNVGMGLIEAGKHKASSKAVNHYKEKSPFFLDTEMENKMMEVEMDYKNCSKAEITTEDAVNHCSQPTEQGNLSHAVGRFGDSNSYNLPEFSADGKLMLFKSPEEIGHEHEYDGQTSFLATDTLACLDGKQAPEIPVVYQYPQEKPKKKSRSGIKRRKDRRHRHHKRHKRKDFEEEEEDDDDDASDYPRKESRSDRKLKRHEKTYHRRRHHKNHEDSKRKRRRWEVHYSSLDDSSSSCDDEYKKEYINSSKKHSRSSKRRHSLSSSSSR